MLLCHRAYMVAQSHICLLMDVCFLGFLRTPNLATSRVQRVGKPAIRVHRFGVMIMPIDWSRCPTVAAKPGYLSGKPALRDDPRVPPEIIVENLDLGETPEQVIENYGLRTPLIDVLAVYAYAKKQRVTSSV